MGKIEKLAYLTESYFNEAYSYDFSKIIIFWFLKVWAIGEFFWLSLKFEIVNEVDAKIKLGFLNPILKFILTNTAEN